MSLTVEELEEKIKRAKKDIEELRSVGDSSRRAEVLSEYLDMLEEDLFNAKRASHQKTQGS